MKKTILLSTFLLVSMTGSTVLANVQQRDLIADRGETARTSSQDFLQLAIGDESLGGSSGSKSKNVWGSVRPSKGNTGLTGLGADFNQINENAKRERERREAEKAMLAKLSDEELEQRIERSKQILEEMQSDFELCETDLKGWLAESQDAEEKAMIASLKMLATGGLGMRGIKNTDTKTFNKLRELAEESLEALRYDGKSSFVKVNLYNRNENFIQVRTKLEIAQKLISKLNPQFADFAEDCSDYITEAGRWALSAEQIGAINKSLDDPKGKLEAQKKMKKLMEDLVTEQNSRK